MTVSRYISSLGFLLLVGAYSPAAQADAHVFAMQCDVQRDRVMIRFGMNGGWFAPVPTYLAKEWEHVPTTEYAGSLQRSCTFRDRQNVIVSMTTSVENLQVSGGGDLWGFFSLKIDGNQVYRNKLYYTGSGISLYQISAITFSSKSLLVICRAHQMPEQTGLINSAPTCEKTPLHLKN